MVYHYKHYRREMANLYPEQNINWYEDTRKFYFELDLPKEFNKNEVCTTETYSNGNVEQKSLKL